jgi:NAD(P)-dependent dehydrogenase (short-subunit alcohol dehydrogenase family)
MESGTQPRRAFDFTGEVAIVSGAGSRMSGNESSSSQSRIPSPKTQRFANAFHAGEIGNGRAIAVLLARQGASVALLDINIAWAQETKALIDAEGGISYVIQVDVTDETSCAAAVAKTVERFGAVHILVNVVGVGGAMGDATAVDLLAWERDMRINVTSMLLMARHAIPEMRKAGRGAIVNISSVSGLLGGNPSLLYPTSKGAIIQLTRAMAAQHGIEGIRVNCVCPGMVYTPMVRRGGEMSEDMRRARINQNLLKQEGEPWDVGYGTSSQVKCSSLAGIHAFPALSLMHVAFVCRRSQILTSTHLAVLFLCSKEAKWITGLIMPVDGGTTAGKSVGDRPALEADVLAEQMTGIPNRG